MRRPAAAAAAAALALALMLAAAAPAAAQLFQPEGPWAVGVRSEAEALLFKQLVSAMTVVAESELTGKPMPEGVVVAASAPKNISADMVTQMLGQVFAAASLDTIAGRTLGAPKFLS
jgi:hypothetical protein